MSNSHPPTPQNAVEPNNDPIADTVGKVTQEAAEVVENVVESASQTAQQLFEQTTETAGNTLSAVADNPLIKFFSDKLGADWLKTLLGGVDVEKVNARVRAIQQEHPEESPSQIAHRLIVKKALYAAGVGFTTNIIPPIAAALLGIELIATAKMQAEMVYEIAAAHGLDLYASTRRGEVIAIFGLALGSETLKAGLGFVEMIPGVGAVVGASSNAVMFYALGFIATRLYEQKQQSATVDPIALQAESEAYIKTLLSQREIMDRILVHMVLASYPGRSWSHILPNLPPTSESSDSISASEQSWSDILLELRSMDLSPASIDAIATHLKNPQPLQDLLEQLESDCAVVLLAQCRHIAQIDGVVTDAEAKILDAIRQRVNTSESDEVIR
ncbi:hypothetical protein IQ249_25475 [Lusitaniella coriacea LEGE 07157]|uniref:Uncharacterized protein n=1 Tax=Lusitaniella coriacea LEGE 07157 TaxID=945747 RepID=A0A8J7JG17_9CYAN|nr:hypothetical protein [Lusitaniella coriacea]MBE9119205.1 hypothetical protein [Lusitaniella coriacea LEGE 07157]